MTSIIRPSTSNNNQQKCRWHGYPTSDELEQDVTRIILNAASQAINLHQEFHLVLAGGTTPRSVYERLRAMPADWQAWHIYFGDERCLPADNAERNSSMAATAWLKHVGIPASHIHTIPAELGADTAANAYAQTLSKVGIFDLVILGLGEDGHTASLFPEHDWGIKADAPDTLAVFDAPKPPPHRVTLTAKRLNQTRQLMFLVTGSAKRKAVSDWKNGKNIPASSISPACGIDVYLEETLLKE